MDTRNKDTRNKLVIRGPRAGLLSLLGGRADPFGNGGRRDLVLEERLRSKGLGGDNRYCFSCTDAPGRAAVALWFQPRSWEEWHVLTIIPLGRPKLSDAEWNGILEEFKTAFLDPLSRGTAVQPLIVAPQLRLED